MYLPILRLWNFRKYCAGADNKPGLEIHFRNGVNVLIGENDSGKTAIVDAIRYVLRTQSGEFIQFEDKDFVSLPLLISDVVSKKPTITPPYRDPVNDRYRFIHPGVRSTFRDGTENIIYQKSTSYTYDKTKIECTKPDAWA